MPSVAAHEGPALIRPGREQEVAVGLAELTSSGQSATNSEADSTTTPTSRSQRWCPPTLNPGCVESGGNTPPSPGSCSSVSAAHRPADHGQARSRGPGARALGSSRRRSHSRPTPSGPSGHRDAVGRPAPRPDMISSYRTVEGTPARISGRCSAQLPPKARMALWYRSANHRHWSSA